MVRHLTLLSANAAAQFIGTLTAFTFTWLGARLLSVGEYGELRTAMVLLPLLMISTLPGFDAVILRAASQKQAVPLGKVLRARMLLGLAASAVLGVALVALHTQLSAPLLFFLVCIALLLPFFEVATGYRNYLLGHRRSRAGTRLFLQARLATLALFVLGVALVLQLKLSFLLILPLWMLAMILPAFLSLLRVIRRRGRWRASGGQLNLRAALRLTLAGLLATAAFSADKLWLRQSWGAEALALYSILILIPQELARVMESSFALYYRRLFFTPMLQRRHLLALAAVGLPLLMLAYSIGFYLLAAPVFGPAYQYSFSLVLLSSLLIPGLLAEYFCTHWFYTQKGESFLLAFSAGNLLFTLLAVGLGLLGGSMATVLLALFIKQLSVCGIFLLLARWSAHVHPH